MPVVAPRRLGGLRSGPTRRAPRGPRVPPKPQANAQRTCPNPSCTEPDIAEEDGQIICRGCYTEIADANIVSEVTFEEQAGGRATVQGGTVNDHSRHAKTLGAGAYRKGVGGEKNSMADIQNTGKKLITELTRKLGIDDAVCNQAQSVWVLAANINFSAGRKTDEVLAACIYGACRRQKDNKILLMDIAEMIQINVFRLGEVYKDLCKELFISGDPIGHQNLVELEPLIYKYCNKLEFGEKTPIVAADALKIIRRMNRDWIVSGRHPAGLCGACIILAARMNNFQRTVREVVFVSKVADITIAKRVEEFRRTKSAGLTIEEFRSKANMMKYQHDPPSVSSQEQRERVMKKRMERREEHMRMRGIERASQERASQAPVEIPDNASNVSSRATSQQPGEAISGEAPRPPSVPPMLQPTSSAQSQSPAPPESLPGALTTPPATQNSPKRKPDDAGTSAENGVESADDIYNAPKRQRLAAPVTTDPTIQPGTRVTTQASTQSTQPIQQIPRFDADGFAIPALPLPGGRSQTPSTEPTDRDSSPKRGRGRPRGSKNFEPLAVDLSEEELAEEDYLETQIEGYLQDGEVNESKSEVEKAKEEERFLLEQKRAAILAEQQQAIDAAKSKADREARGLDYFGDIPEWNPGETLDAEALELEFLNDPEVENCLLRPEEVKIKEQIWVAHNEDWLRKQAEKDMMAKVAKVSGDRGGRGRKGKNGQKTRKKRGKMGDGTVLTESATPIETPEDAARAMLEKRAPHRSQFVDFSALQRIYGRETPSSSRASSAVPEDGRAQTPAGTPAPSDVGSQASQARSPDADDQDMEDAPEEEIAEPCSPPRVLPANWDTFDPNTAGQEEDEVAEEDYDRAMNMERDEFGVIGGGEFDDYDEEGDEYE